MSWRGEAVRAIAALHRALDPGAKLGLGRRIAGSADQPEELHAAADGDRLVARARTKQRAQHLGLRTRQPAIAGGRHDRGQALDAFRMLDGEDLRDHAAHRAPTTWALCDSERVHEAERVARHVVERIGRSRPAGQTRRAPSSPSSRATPADGMRVEGRRRGCRSERHESRARRVRHRAIAARRRAACRGP